MMPRVKMNRCAFFVLSLLIVLLPPLFLYGGEAKSVSGTSTGAATEKAPVYAPMPGPGKKVPIEGGYLIYGFDKKPKLGTVIMKVEMFTAEGKKDTSLEAKADAGMPSMKGAHETGDRAFTVSKKGGLSTADTYCHARRLGNKVDHLKRRNSDLPGQIQL